MRQAILLAVSFIAITLAGCSDAPPSGEFTSSGSAFAPDGHVHSSLFQDFNDPTSNPGNDAGVPSCLADGAPAQLDPVLGTYRCTQAYSEINYLFLALPTATGYSMGLYDTTGTNTLDGVSTITDNGDGTFFWNFTREGENIKDKYDAVALLYNDKPVAVSGLSDGSALEPVEALKGISFSVSYDGKDLTLTLTGTDMEAGFSYTAWLVSQDETGAYTHDESFSVSEGETMFKAEQNIDKYDEVHVHLTGTSINVAKGTVA